MGLLPLSQRFQFFQHKEAQINNMSQKTKKQFGVWMDTHHATIVGRANADVSTFTILGHAGNTGATRNGSEKSEHNEEKNGAA